MQLTESANGFIFEILESFIDQFLGDLWAAPVHKYILLYTLQEYILILGFFSIYNDIQEKV